MFKFNKYINIQNNIYKFKILLYIYIIFNKTVYLNFLI